jgi:hypothetical protein
VTEPCILGIATEATTPAITIEARISISVTALLFLEIAERIEKIFLAM